MDKKYQNWTTAYIEARSNQLNESKVEEKLSPKEMKKRLALIKKAVEKINKQNADAAKKDALKMMKASGMFDEDVDEALVGPNAVIVKQILDALSDKMQDALTKGDRDGVAMVNQIAKMVGLGVTQKSQAKGKSFSYKLKNNEKI